MKFVLACHGARGDVEPSIVIGRELLRRGHDVSIAVPPNMISFAEEAGLKAVGYGQDSRFMIDAQREYWTCFFRIPWKMKDLDRLGREIGEIVRECWTVEATSALASLADGADMVIAGYGFEQFAANVAEYYDIPLATLHFFPLRANGKVLPFLPGLLGRAAMTAYEWMSWSGPLKQVEAAQRRELGLPEARTPWPHRMAQQGALEIQCYDDVVVPGLAAEWAKWGGQRPFTGTLTLESPTDSGEEVASWIAAGTPPIFFGFGGVPVGSPADTIAVISAVCSQLGERALVGAGATDFSEVPNPEHVKVVGQVNYSTVFPTCRAVVHHGGAGTIAACMRAGVPQVSLWTLPDQSLRTAQLKRLKVGTGRRFSSITVESLVKDLRRVMGPQYRTRAQALATQMTTPTESAAAAADLVERAVRTSREFGSARVDRRDR
ncbi:glycosyltransferase [Mycolicibacterium holsaticum]|uniref:glycosyltransferase n=1 Tax=Mycolicibacterium holsaticum TaxID=152142 RepID=UPI001C7D301E|nr:glycosyltransferase [Mycolicibacterium holsaticum]MDA4110868.1 glycosyl transferase family 1 [Mycolicibacterium holsaticum DSM 44478 = JCM 12374]QZA12187.1 glycosyltransferase [Mycolicibacterium holsaticum DSM 44478 = JCM 12374]UNC10327.1 glycosyltransferase [Mycolicibacterium holsaticum DSM 44478 = JCM 12374]